jgi:hydrogenase maturation protease
MNEREGRILVIGYGNPGRHDDGLGPAFASAVEKLALENVTVEADYQLTLEDAATIAEHDVVVFVDATTSGPEPFSFRRIQPNLTLSFSSHSIQPASVLALAHELFGAETEGYLLGIRGYELDGLGERLSRKAQSNMEMALGFLLPVMRRGPLRKKPVGVGGRGSPSMAARSSYA